MNDVPHQKLPVSIDTVREQGGRSYDTTKCSQQAKLMYKMDITFLSHCQRLIKFPTNL